MTGIYKTETYQNNTLVQIFCIQLRQKAIELFLHYSALPRWPDDAFPERFQFCRGSNNILYRYYTRGDSMILMESHKSASRDFVISIEYSSDSELQS